MTTTEERPGSAAGAVASRLRTIHERSVIRHRALLGAGADPEKVLAAYFDDLACYLGGDGEGCPFSSARAEVSREPGISPASQDVLDEVKLHKHFHRDFFVDLASRFTSKPQRAEHVGEVFFLLYSGATTEAQNIGETWPVGRARHAALELARSEKKRDA